MSNEVSADLGELRARVRGDRRTVTAPLLVFGALIVLHAVAWIAAATAPARHIVLFVYWPIAGAVALFALWAHANRVAERAGVGGGPRSYRPVALGYLVSLPLLAILFIPAFFLGVFAPLLWPATILWAVAARQHSHSLRTVARILTAAGVAQLLLVLISTGVDSVVADWLPYTVDVLTGVGLLVAYGVASRRRVAGGEASHGSVGGGETSRVGDGDGDGSRGRVADGKADGSTEGRA